MFCSSVRRRIHRPRYANMLTKWCWRRAKVLCNGILGMPCPLYNRAAGYHSTCVKGFFGTMPNSSSPLLITLFSSIHIASNKLTKADTASFSPNSLLIKKIYVPLHTLSPDGGIGRRAGLKHQWSNPSRFDPGSGYYKPLVNRWFTRDFSFSTCTKSVLCNNTMRKVYFHSFPVLSFMFN